MVVFCEEASLGKEWQFNIRTSLANSNGKFSNSTHKYYI